MFQSDGICGTHSAPRPAAYPLYKWPLMQFVQLTPVLERLATQRFMSGETKVSGV